LSTAYSSVETLKKELLNTQMIATRKVQELSAELGNQRSVAASLREALQTAQTALETESSLKYLHDVQALRAQLEVRRVVVTSLCSLYIFFSVCTPVYSF